MLIDPLPLAALGGATVRTNATRPLLIGLVAPAGAGKDTVAAYLEDHYAFCAIAFADPVRDMLGALIQHIDVDGAWLVERDLKEFPMPVIERSYRELAQTLGTTWGRNNVHQDLWLRIAAYHVAHIHRLGSNAVVSDVRHPNEAAWVKGTGGTLVRLFREQAPAVRIHASELFVPHIACDHEIHNHGSKATLYEQLDRLMASLGSEPA